MQNAIFAENLNSKTMVIRDESVLIVTDQNREFGAITAPTLSEMGKKLGVSHQAVSKALLNRRPVLGRWIVKKVSRLFLVKDVAGVYRVCVKNKGGEFVDLNKGWTGKEVETVREITQNAWEE